MLETQSIKPAKKNLERHKREGVIPSRSHSDNSVSESVDCIPPNIPNSSHLTRLHLFADTAAEIQRINKGRSPNLRHVTRTHRVDLDWLSERVISVVLFLINSREHSTNRRIYFDKGSVHHDAMAFFVDSVAKQTAL